MYRFFLAKARTEAVDNVDKYYRLLYGSRGNRVFRVLACLSIFVCSNGGSIKKMLSRGVDEATKGRIVNDLVTVFTTDDQILRV